MVAKARLMKGCLTGRIYVIRSYKELPNGVIQVTGKKEDVTEDFNALTDQLQTEGEELKQIAIRISTIHPSHINALENGPLKITLHAIQRDARQFLNGEKQ